MYADREAKPQRVRTDKRIKSRERHDAERKRERAVRRALVGEEADVDPIQSATGDTDHGEDALNPENRGRDT
eukprot:6981734-Heterocapsa_arctica.AAC.1